MTAQKKAYSIAEALITVFIIAVIIAVISPSLAKRNKYLNKIFNVGKHGIYTCKDETCTFIPPEGVKDVYIIAASAGGGGAGTVCGKEITNYSGAVESDVTLAINPNGKMKVEAIAGGGASCQGKCDMYPFGKFDPALHAKRCKIYSSAFYTTKEEIPQYKEVYNPETKTTATVVIGYKQEDVKHGIVCDFNGTPDKKCSEATLGDSDEGNEVCGKSWIHKPEVGNPDRSCNAAVYGPCGADGAAASAEFCAWKNSCLKRDERGKCALSETPQNIPSKIGGSGRKDGGSANPTKVGSYMDLAGGPGCAGGPDAGGSKVNGAGGSHSGMSKAWSEIPVPNTEDGGVGRVTVTEKYIMWGGGGQPGRTKAGYFKNITGPIVMTVGKGGNGGATNGLNGGPTIVRAQKGGYSVTTKTVHSGKNLTDKGSGLLLEVNGGLGGIQYKYYESCDSSENYFDTLKGGEHYNAKSHGGNGGVAGDIDNCPQTIGADGKEGLVVIFY